MKNNYFINEGLVITITAFFIILAITPVIIGHKVSTKDQELIENFNNDDFPFYRYNRYYLPESYHSEKYTFEIDVDDVTQEVSTPSKEAIETSIIEKKEPSVKATCEGPIDSPWPMYCHDVRHTGHSPYSTVDTWDEIWRLSTGDWATGDVVIDDDGTIYIGSTALYAVYPNGSLKWKYVTYMYTDSAPAIDENGIIYFGNIYGDYLFAIYASNGTLKWKYSGGSIFSSPAIGNDGTIYFCDGRTGKIIALYPNGTLKWSYQTNHVTYSSPAIGDDGTVYCGSHDTYLYALYPNNGTVKWKYKTGHWVRVSPCIADDGTIYVVSLDEYLHALYPNGSLKWKTNVGAGTSPTIGQDGTIYCGYTKLYAVNPTNGSVKWTFDVAGKIKGSTPCNSIDGTIYFGTSGGWVYAVYPDGNLKWRKKIATDEVDSAPAIGENGTIYIGSASHESGNSCGYLHAFGIGELQADANGPYYGLINEPVQFEGNAMGGYSPHTYFWDFGDGGTSDEQNPTHTYTEEGNYTVALTVTDNSSNTSSDTTWAWIQTSNDPPNKPSITGETNGDVGTSYDYTFTASDPDGSIIWYYVDWGDNTNMGWIGPYSSGQQLTLSHSWSNKGTYNISAKAKDPYGAESEWGTLEVTMPVNQQNSQSHSSSQQSIRSLLFQILQQLLSHLKLVAQ